MMNLFENLQLMHEAEENYYDPNNYIWDGKSEVPRDVVNVTIKDGVTDIDYYTFASCESLKEVNIPDSVTEIGIATFEYCKSLQKVNIFNTKTKIGEDAFSKCPNVKVYKNGKSNDHDNNDYDNTYDNI